jgi:hypothetical protein
MAPSPNDPPAPVRPPPVGRGRPSRYWREAGAERNARITGLTAAVLVVLLAAEGFTLLGIHRLLRPHVFVGMLLVPPLLLKMASTGWRFARYYLGSPAYRAKGPPPLLLRLLGPVVVLLTVVMVGSGIALLLVPHSARSSMLFVHKASFVLWFGAMTLHVLGHLVDTARLAPSDFVARTRQQVSGAGMRLWLQAAALVAGAILGIVTLPLVTTWLTSGGGFQGG